METKYSKCDSAPALRDLASSLISQGSFQEASFALKRAQELEPGNAETYRARGYSEFMCGNYDDCIAANDKALEINSNDTYSMGGRALALYHLGKLYLRDNLCFPPPESEKSGLLAILTE